MRTSHIVDAIQTAYRLQEPLFIWGPPGIGKSDMVAQVARRLKIGLIDFRMALRDPTDIKGFPMPEQKTKTMKFFRDSELPVDGEGILFMDELNSAAQATQAAGMQLTLTRRIGDYVLPEGWSVVGAGNREGDRGVVHRMPSPLANRFTHVEAEVNTLDWIDYALDHDINPKLIAFIRARDELLFKFDPKIDSKAFPTPRSWVRGQRFVEQEKDDAHVRLGLLKGTVGDGPGAEYWAFLQMIDELPTLEEIRMEPKKAKLPAENKMSARYAVATLMGANAKNDSFESFLTYAERMDKEFQTIFVKDVVRRDAKLRTNKAYLKWALANHEVIV